jgi:phenylalanyl-tRNA synthetase alpha chain
VAERETRTGGLGEFLASVEKISVSFDAAPLAPEEELRATEGRFLGKGGELATLSRSLGKLSPDEKREAGAALQALRARVTQVVSQHRKQAEIAETAARERAEIYDLSEDLVRERRSAIGALTVVSQTRRELEDLFVGMGFKVETGPEVESEWYNFEALNVAKHHPARDAQDSFFLDLGEPGSVVLRTQTSPVQVRLLETGVLPIYAVAPGKVFRRDTPDARHTPSFHQIEGLVVDEHITFQDLSGTVSGFTKAYFGQEISARLRPAYFPFTEPSAEFEITCTICLGEGCRTCSGVGWIELGGCGMVHPNVFRAVGVDPERWSGFAFGFGIERLAQMKHGLADMRVLLDNDLRFLSQFRG